MILTVWKKSLLFNCSTFMVFDGKGNLVFKVDNYAARDKDEIILMDAFNKPLLMFMSQGVELVILLIVLVRDLIL